MENISAEKFDLWCIIELFGHSKIAGKCTEQNIAGTNMLRVDVPETEKQPSFTRFFGSGAIYAINPVDEKTARFMADKLEIKPIESWNISEVAKKHNILLMQSQKEPEPKRGYVHSIGDDDDDDDINDDDDPGF